MSPEALPVERENGKQRGCSSRGNKLNQSGNVLYDILLKRIKAMLADLDGVFMT